MDVMLRSLEIAHDLHARLLIAIHYRIQAGDELAVSWPDWKNNGGQFGFVFRVFGNEDALGEYAKVIDTLKKHELIRMFPCLPVPAHTSKVVFARDRERDKFSPSATRRMEKRAQQRGEIFVPNAPPTKVCHFLTVLSASSSQKFCMYVRRDVEGREQESGNQYGLGHLVPNF